MHNLQILLMWSTKCKFSECLAPLHKHEDPNGRLYGDGSAQARRHGGHSGAVTLNLFCALPKFCCAQRNLFQTHDKNKNIYFLKMYFGPLNP